MNAQMALITQQPVWISVDKIQKVLLITITIRYKLPQARRFRGEKYPDGLYFSSQTWESPPADSQALFSRWIQRCGAKEITKMKREIRATISLLLKQLQCEGYAELVRQELFHEFTAQDNSPQVSWDESQLAPRLHLASSLFRIRQRLERLSVEINFVNSRGYLDRLQAFAGSVPSLQIFVLQKLN